LSTPLKFKKKGMHLGHAHYPLFFIYIYIYIIIVQ
jgi:hypothetical protein